MKRNVLLSLTFMTILFMADTNASQRIKNCGSSATQEMSKALSFVQTNITTIMADTSRLTPKEKKKLRKKILSVNLKCMDHKQVCKKDPDRAGVSRHIFNSAIVICYNSIKDFYGNNAFCALADTITHEFGHTAGVYKAKGHNDGPNNDRVYRLGDSAESLCNRMGLDRSLPRNTNE